MSRAGRPTTTTKGDSLPSVSRRAGSLASLLGLVAAALLGAPSAQAEEPSAPAPSTASAAPAPAPATPAEKRGLSLSQALALADKNHPKIAAARARLSSSRYQLDEAHSAPFSLFKLSGGVGIAPELAGTSAYSPDSAVSLSSGVALAWQVKLEGAVPLWTFGKIENLWDAAEANVKVQAADVEKERDLVRLDVRKAYYGLLLARDGKLLLADVKKQLDDAEKSMADKVKAGDGDQLDLFKLQTFTGEVDVRAAEADKYVDVALAGLRFYTGVADFDVPDVALAPPTHKLLAVEDYLAAAVKFRPELAQARAGVEAREAQVRMAESGFYPNIGLGLSLGIGVAPEIDDQTNPFAYDPANFFNYGAALVFEWNLDFVPQLARLNQAKSTLAEMHAIKHLADSGIEAEIRVAHAEVADWEKRRAAFAKSTAAAKRWIVYVQQGIDVGTVEDKELLDAAKAYALSRFSTMNATMELDLALAKLAQVTGWDAIAPDGVSVP